MKLRMLWNIVLIHIMNRQPIIYSYQYNLILIDNRIKHVISHHFTYLIKSIQSINKINKKDAKKVFEEVLIY